MDAKSFLFFALVLLTVCLCLFPSVFSSLGSFLSLFSFPFGFFFQAVETACSQIQQRLLTERGPTSGGGGDNGAAYGYYSGFDPSAGGGSMYPAPRDSSSAYPYGGGGSSGYSSGSNYPPGTYS